MSENSYFEGIKKRSSLVIEKHGYVGCFFRDRALGMQVGVLELFKNGQSIIHATLHKNASDKKVEETMDYYLKFLENY